MADKKKKSRLRRRLRLALLNDQTFEQVWSIGLKPINVFLLVAFVGIIGVAAITYLIAFTGLREYIPGYPTGEERRLIMDNLNRADSIIDEVKKRDALINDIRMVIAEQLPDDVFARDSVKLSDGSFHITFSRSEADDTFRKQVEAEDRSNVHSSLQNLQEIDNKLELMFLYTPLKGMVTNKYGETYGHLGVDIVAAEGSHVSAVLSGTVIMSEWTVETGYVLIIQHDNQLVSVYKHNSKLLKKAGQRVTAGEAIAIMGNSGEQTTNPHLHFELWYQGVPLNPENYIQFL